MQGMREGTYIQGTAATAAPHCPKRIARNCDRHLFRTPTHSRYSPHRWRDCFLEEQSSGHVHNTERENELDENMCGSTFASDLSGPWLSVAIT